MSNTKNSKKQKKQEILEESETTENEFSELDVKNEVRKRGLNQQEALRKIKESVSNKKEDAVPEPKQILDRNVPIPVKASNFKVRTIWTLVMLFGFVLIIAAGHLYCALFILAMNYGMVKEILSLKRNRERESEINFSVKLNWYFFAVIAFYFYGKLFTNVLARVTLTNKVIYVLVNYHDFITFALWIAGFLMFTLSLKKGYLRYQFRQFGWTHISVLLIVGQGSAMVNNLYEGIIWFILPCLLVISNDVFAYIFGILYGKTRLIELSPKKTVEGFIGGMISTFFFAFFFAWMLSKIDYLICPQHELVFMPFKFGTCTPPMTFNRFDYYLPNFLGLGQYSIRISEFQIHAMILGLFTSLVSPFGGFFASGFKRAIKVKDFADVIPGHGGITDRMDCQVLTGTFVYMYVQHIVNGRINYASGVSRFILNEMDIPQQIMIFNLLQENLIQKGILNSTLVG